MKKAIVKNLRKLAQDLPPMQQRKVFSRRKYGYEILEDLEKTITDPEELDKALTQYSYIEPKLVYRVPYVQLVPVLHENNLKTIYKKDGMTGVVGYMNEVRKVALQQAAAQGLIDLSQATEVQQLSSEAGDLLPNVLDVPEGTVTAEGTDPVS